MGFTLDTHLLRKTEQKPSHASLLDISNLVDSDEEGGDI